jgi:choline kinase
LQDIEGVILAAGYSSRFNFDDCTFKKFLLPLKKTIILNYVIAGMYSAGIRKINIIVDENIDKLNVIECCSDFSKNVNLNFDDLKLNLVENRFSERENGYSLYLGAQAVSSKVFVLSMADHVFSKNVYDILIQNYKGQEIVLATDPMKIKGIYDLEDCTKVFGENDKILKIGKRINQYNRLDMGAFIMNSKAIKKKSQEIEKNYKKFGVSNILLACIASKERVYYFDLPNTIWVDVDNETEYNKLKKNFNESNSFTPFGLDI